MPPPVIDGIRKDPKPGGYADSGADIAHALRMAGVQVATPGPHPDPARDPDWVFPDTPEGIAAARAAGATLLWANTVLLSGHPLEAVMDRCWIVDHPPASTQEAEDKSATNSRLRAAGLPVAASILTAPQARPGVHALASLNPAALAAPGSDFPLVLKPVGGRGSHGVTRVDDHAAFMATAAGPAATTRTA